MIITITICV